MLSALILVICSMSTRNWTFCCISGWHSHFSLSKKLMSPSFDWYDGYRWKINISGRCLLSCPRNMAWICPCRRIHPWLSKRCQGKRLQLLPFQVPPLPPSLPLSVEEPDITNNGWEWIFSNFFGCILLRWVDLILHLKWRISDVLVESCRV